MTNLHISTKHRAAGEVRDFSAPDLCSYLMFYQMKTKCTTDVEKWHQTGIFNVVVRLLCLLIRLLSRLFPNSSSNKKQP